jgi:vacuolar-type H+-ATPase subunit F/Vma7
VHLWKMNDDASLERLLPGAILFLGGEIEAAAFRLAGVVARVPPAGQEAAAFERARREAAVVLLSSSCASLIPLTALEGAWAAPAPLVLVLPELGGPARFDHAARVRRLLGVET